MKPDSKIYVAGHRGLAGSALVRRLLAARHSPQSLLLRTHQELDLTDPVATSRCFQEERPEYVFLAAAKVGGILANDTYPAEFIRDNLAIQTNVIHEAYRAGVKRLLFLGSSCIYPKLAPQPLKEEYLLTGPLEPTNRPYALAKIAGIEMCWSYNRQYGTKYLAAMPTNLYGPGDNYGLRNSHVLPALIRKSHEAKQRADKEVVVWGTGAPRREFLYSDDMADACIYLMNLPDEQFASLLSPQSSVLSPEPLAPSPQSSVLSPDFFPPLINIGVGEDVTIAELAGMVTEVIGFKGKIVFDTSKPDGTPRKLLDVSRLRSLGFTAKTPFLMGIRFAYEDFLRSHESQQ
jgi:GDP-L-fucose synthase